MESTGGTITSVNDDFKVEETLFTYSEKEKEEQLICKNNSELVLNPLFIPVYPQMIRCGFSYLESIIYGFIVFFLGTNEKFYCSNEQLGNMLGVSEKTVSIAVKKLIEEELIKVSYKTRAGGGKIRIIRLYKNVNSDFTKTLTQSLQKCKGIENKVIENKKRNIKEKEKTKYLEFVYLTDDEYNKLVEEYGKRITDDQIQNLNNYIGQNGKDKYKSHYYTILAWNKKAGFKKLTKKEENETGIYDLPF